MDSNSTTELILRIKGANAAYRTGDSIISDTEYDNLVDTLKGILPSDEFEKFRATLFEDPGKVKHPYAMGSLDKIKAFDESASIRDWILKNVPDTGDSTDGLFISSKIDGCSARVTYSEGKLVGASTRGNGEYGVDILRKAALFMPNELAHKFTGDIRGEITLTNETIDALSELNGKTYKNLRNATVGLVNSKDATDEEISFLRFFPYEIMGESGLTKKQQFDKLKSLGFETALSKEVGDIYGAEIPNGQTDVYDRMMLAVFNDFSSKAPFDIDGLVVSDANDSRVFENVLIPSHTVAVKFNQMTAETRLIDISWEVSKSGRLSPVGIIDAVNLGGSTISNATLNNLRIMKDMGFRYGCGVTVLKSGDVIPKIVGVSHPNPENEVDIELPKLCPSCGHELSYEEDALFPFCTNPNCDSIVHNKILHFLRQLGIKHVSLKTIAKFNLRSISDLVELKPDGGAVKKTFYDDLNKRMFGASKEQLLSAFDYDGVSTQIIDKMVAHYGYDRLISSSFDELKGDLPYGVGLKFLGKFCDGYSKIKKDYDMILGHPRYYGQSSSKSSTVEQCTGVLGGKGFVVTGPLETMSRDGFKQTVISNGGCYQSSVSKKTSFLVCNDVSTATTKVKKAESLGVKVINESKFLNMLRDGSDGFALF